MSNVLYRASGALSTDSDGRTVYGLAVPYGVTSTVSDDGRTTYPERFAVGAFNRSIREQGHKVRLFVQHDTLKLPIGKPTELRDAQDGVHAAFGIAKTREGDDALELVRAGIVDGFSVGFAPMVHRRQSDGTMLRTEASLREVSLVHSPAYPDALVAGVRSAVRPSLSVDIARRRLDLILTNWSD